MTELIGKSFKYKSKHGLSTWTGKIKEVQNGFVKMIGIGEPIRFIETVKGDKPVYKDYESKQIYIIISDKNVMYELDEIEILNNEN